jgi:hypothetical protein
LPLAADLAHGADSIIVAQLHPDDVGLAAEDLALERKGKTLADRGVKADGLLGLGRRTLGSFGAVAPRDARDRTRPR